MVANPMTRRSESIVTRRTLAAPPERVWNALMFYEEIEEPPPLHLRLLLPLPIRTDGSKLAVGDQAKCLYDRGHLVKRVTNIEPCRHYGFEIVEQHLVVGGGLILSGGGYTLRELSPRTTEVTVTTRYVSRKRPGWFWKPIEATVCHMFHRYLLSAIERGIESH
jgi:hypothetical protein